MLMLIENRTSSFTQQRPGQEKLRGQLVVYFFGSQPINDIFATKKHCILTFRNNNDSIFEIILHANSAIYASLQ